MKKILSLFTLLASIIAFSQVGVGTSEPSAKSILDLRATDKGFLLPRLTTLERIGIAPNATTDIGMQVYDTDKQAIWYWNGTAWTEATSKFTNNATNSRVELTNLSNGLTSRTAGNEFVIKDNGAVGIGLTSPNASALLDVSSTTKGFLMPRMNTTERIAIAAPASGLEVYDTDTKTNWIYNGATWTSSGPTYGDIKTGIQPTDHNGWIKLDGRSKSSLTATQQVRATALGVGSNLPDATNSFLVQNGTALGSVSNSNTKTIVQANLPNVAPTITIANTTTSMQNAGWHNHYLSNGHQGENDTGWNSGKIVVTDRGVNGNGGYTDGSGTHTHDMNPHNHTATASSINGGVAQTALDITPKSLSVTTFIYLGY